MKMFWRNHFEPGSNWSGKFCLCNIEDTVTLLQMFHYFFSVWKLVIFPAMWWTFGCGLSAASSSWDTLISFHLLCGAMKRMASSLFLFHYPIFWWRLQRMDNQGNQVFSSPCHSSMWLVLHSPFPLSSKGNAGLRLCFMLEKISAFFLSYQCVLSEYWYRTANGQSCNQSFKCLRKRCYFYLAHMPFQVILLSTGKY